MLEKTHHQAKFHQHQEQHALPARRITALLVGSIFVLLFILEYFQNPQHWQSIFVPRVIGILWAFSALYLMQGYRARHWGTWFHLSCGLAPPLAIVWFGYELDRIGVSYLAMTHSFAVVDLVLLATASRFQLLCLAAISNWVIAISSLHLFRLPDFAVTTVIENVTISLLLSLSVGRIMLRHAERNFHNLRKLKSARRRVELSMRELARNHREMQHMADRDLLTGLFNRRAGLRHINHLLENAPRQSVLAMLEIDLDRFKPINDQYGHKAGDVVLQISAERMMTALQHGDVCCRFGGDEFVVALCRPERRQIEQLITELDYALSRPIALPSGAVVAITASIGSCEMQPDTHLEALIEQADNAMYLKKRQRSQDPNQPFAERRQAAGGTTG